MARLHEHQGKAILARAGVAVPRGGVAETPDQAAAHAASIGGPCVVKIQAWTTGRAAIGGIGFAATPTEAADHARRMLGMRVGNFPVTQVLVEERVSLVRELFVSIAIDDRERAPVMLMSLAGGSGIEDRAANVHRIGCDVADGPDAVSLRRAVDESDLPASAREPLLKCLGTLFAAARAVEARSLEVNPLGLTADHRVIAADCRVTIDDYAVFRHPELGIEIARELDHPPTALERVAYAVEQDDHRGTFYFAQLAVEPASDSRGLAGFHGAGGGGSMMAMDAITAEGFTIANFTDTSGNPSAAKVYRAARIILAQPGLVGYFGSGSGVASQEQFWSAYGLAKAFWELELDIPAVIRLGGNAEDRAVEILESACRALPATVEGYRKTDAPAFIARRFAELVAQNGNQPGASTRTWQPRPRRIPPFVGRADAVSFPIKGGCVWIDAARWSETKAAILANASGLLRDDHGKPELSLDLREAAGKDSEFIACEVECRRVGVDAVFVELEIPGLEEAMERTGSAPRSTAGARGV
ncbi:MAG: acetate--CoA ligase family protein [Phycisphaerales bacterium]|nr:acetate--CoA ligase family protein [Phycisphaerales bacterium]